MSSGFDDVVSFAVVPNPPRMFPPVEALVVQQADPPEFAVAAAQRCPCGRGPRRVPHDCPRGRSHY